MNICKNGLLLFGAVIVMAAFMPPEDAGARHFQLDKAEVLSDRLIVAVILREDLPNDASAVAIRGVGDQFRNVVEVTRRTSPAELLMAVTALAHSYERISPESQERAIAIPIPSSRPAAREPIARGAHLLAECARVLRTLRNERPFGTVSGYGDVAVVTFNVRRVELMRTPPRRGAR